MQRIEFYNALRRRRGGPGGERMREQETKGSTTMLRQGSSANEMRV